MRIIRDDGDVISLQHILVVKGVWDDAMPVKHCRQDWRYEPEDSDVSYGRFMVRFEDYRDPEIYKKGRKITVAGKIAGGKVMPLDKLEYTYPVIAPAEIHLWKDERTSNPRFHFGIGIGGVIK